MQTSGLEDIANIHQHSFAGWHLQGVGADKTLIAALRSMYLLEDLPCIAKIFRVLKMADLQLIKSTSAVLEDLPRIARSFRASKMADLQLIKIATSAEEVTTASGITL